MEAALSELCGPSDVITAAYREESEGHRTVWPPQNYRIEHKMQAAVLLWRKLSMRPERYYHPSVGFYEHTADVARARLCRRGGVAQLFQIRLRPQSMDRQVSWYLYKTKTKHARPSVERFMADSAPCYVTNYAHNTIDGTLAVDFARPLRKPRRRPQSRTRACRRRHAGFSPARQRHPNKDEARSYARHARPGWRIGTSRKCAAGLRVSRAVGWSRAESVRLALRASARQPRLVGAEWWAGEGSNLQPDGYELSNSSLNWYPLLSPRNRPKLLMLQGFAASCVWTVDPYGAVRNPKL